MSKVALVTYDYETTGPEPRVDLPVQTAAVLSINGGKHLPIVHAISNPNRKIHPEAVETHGIHQHMVRGYPDPMIVTSMMGNYIDSLNDYGYYVIIAGHNHMRFDNTIAERIGWDAVKSYPQIDTFLLARRHTPLAENHQLGFTYEQLFYEELSGAHDAMADVLGVARLIDKYCELYNMSVKELADFCGTPQVMTHLPFSKKHKGKKFEDVGSGFMKFMMTKTEIAYEDPDFLASIKKHYRYLYDAHYRG